MGGFLITIGIGLEVAASYVDSTGYTGIPMGAWFWYVWGMLGLMFLVFGLLIAVASVFFLPHAMAQFVRRLLSGHRI